VVNQLGVRTAKAHQGDLTRHIIGSGTVLRTTPNNAFRPTTRDLTQSGNSHPSLLILGQVFERDAPLVYSGQSASVRLPGMGSPVWKGTVGTLESQINQATHTLQFRLMVDNEGKQVPGGMTVEITLDMEPLRNVLLVPREAVIVTGKGARVIVAMGNGRFQQRRVDAEDLGEDEIVIRSGLKAGELVVVSAQFMLDSEANLQAGLMRLTGEMDAEAPPIHSHNHEMAMPEETPAMRMHGDNHDMTMPENAAPMSIDRMQPESQQ
jgi:Cu(I)/Ag(I) efflux system membrane fusion protein